MQRDNPLAANLAVINSDLMMLEYGLHKSMNRSLARLEISTEQHHEVAQEAATLLGVIRQIDRLAQLDQRLTANEQPPRRSKPPTHGET